MTAEGEFLSGNFAILQVKEALENMNTALGKMKRNGAAMRPVPENLLPMFGGKEPSPGATKLQVAYRDLPRGETTRPSTAYFQNPYNLGWLDLSATETRSLLAPAGGPKNVAPETFRKLALTTLKDSVRGQAGEWKPAALKSGSLRSEQIGSEGNLEYYRFTGDAVLIEAGRSYRPQLRGLATYDRKRSRFTAFELVASGQREGKNGANGREGDPGPAPMGIALRLYPQ